jgi:hypothetical protein
VNTDDLRVLADRADSIKGRPATRLSEVHQRIRTARRRLAAGAVTGAAALVLAILIAVTLVGGGDHRSMDPVGPLPSPTQSPIPSETEVVPAGQVTIEADVRSRDIRGWTVLDTLTNTQPGHRGASELTTTVTVHSEQTFFATYCHASDPAVWFFYSFTDGGGGYSRCDEGSRELPPPDLYPDAYSQGQATPTTFHMYVGRLSGKAQACYEGRSSDPHADCAERYGTPRPVAGAEFGFRIFDLGPAPTVLTLFGETNRQEPAYRLPALSSIGDDAWLVDRAMVAAPGADRLAVELPASNVARVVDVYTDAGRHKEDRCLGRHADELPDWESTDHNIYEAAVDEVCGVDIRLVVDGTTVSQEEDFYAGGHFMEVGTRLAPGAAHGVAVEVVRGDPRNLSYGIVVRTATQMP